MKNKSKIAVVISGRGSNLNAIITACQNVESRGAIALVISNVKNAPGLEIALKNGVKTATVEHTAFSDRESFDQALCTLLRENNIDWILLAGFMRILTDKFVHHWKGRLVNIHPSLLPLYPGLDTHARALAEGDSNAGASVHFVTPQLDGGPVIIQGKVNIEAGDNEHTLAARVLEIEHIIYPLALQWLLTERAVLKQNLYYLDGETPDRPPAWYQDQLQ